ncbi:hypothetical protein CEXT_565451, partial [Caerostris extrusa]
MASTQYLLGNGIRVLLFVTHVTFHHLHVIDMDLMGFRLMGETLICVKKNLK